MPVKGAYVPASQSWQGELTCHTFRERGVSRARAAGERRGQWGARGAAGRARTHRVVVVRPVPERHLPLVVHVHVLHGLHRIVVELAQRAVLARARGAGGVGAGELPAPARLEAVHLLRRRRERLAGRRVHAPDQRRERRRPQQAAGHRHRQVQLSARRRCAPPGAWGRAPCSAPPRAPLRAARAPSLAASAAAQPRRGWGRRYQLSAAESYRRLRLRLRRAGWHRPAALCQCTAGVSCVALIFCAVRSSVGRISIYRV